MSSIANLLESVSSIIKSYEKVAAITGENFNIFSILKVDSNEVRLHSALLSELLNPSGSHGLNDTFLKLFLKEISVSDFDTEGATVDVEKYIGLISDNWEEGGRIDLLINSKNGESIVIENKIYAGDGFKQLLRYHNKYTNARLMYLTLEGNKPKPESLGTLDIKSVNLISYKYHIINWLEECKKQAVEFPLLRETITQYIYLLKRLTNQSINHEMDEDIIKYILKDSNRIDAAIKIVDSGNAIKFATITKLFENISEKINISYNHDTDEYFNYYSYKKENWNYKITFLVTKNTYKELKIGVLNLEGEERFKNGVLVNKVKEVLADMIVGKDFSVKWNWIWLTTFSAYELASWGEYVNGSFFEKIVDFTLKMIERLESLEGFIKK